MMGSTSKALDTDKRSILSTAFIAVVVITVSSASSANAMLCPVECQCSVQGVSIFVDCSGLALSTLPEFDPAMEINLLDLSHNLLTEFPASLAEFPTLESLDLTGNQITGIAADTLHGFKSLKILTLNKNNITNWQDIHPNELLIGTLVTSLHLAGNPLTSFSATDDSLMLLSPTLRYLDISGCKITKVNGPGVLQGLGKLEYLDLSGNPLRFIPNMLSETLLGLNLANCQLTVLPPDFLAGLTSLVSINLSRNHRLSLMRSNEEFVRSETLTKIDLSLCNMDNVELLGFPQLKSAVLRNNLIKDLSRDSLAANEHLQILDLASNAISQVHPLTFKPLRMLRQLDLSYNMITKVDRETFKENDKLTAINLSRNYISRFSRIVSTSLENLNMSSCEIASIDGDALIGMPMLVELDLSSNLISAIPDSLVSDTLQMLDLRMCRISSIRNTTFINLPELSRLRLSGNRFTTPFRRDFFDQNPYLSEIWLGDNPWRCDCQNNEFQNFFRFVTDSPTKLYDRSHLRCASPEDYYGALWEMACFHYWIQNSRPLGTAEKVWTIVLVGLLVFAGGLCMVMSVKKCIEGRAMTRREAERQAFLEEQRDIHRQNRMAMDQQAQLNAPDPRETCPPCYEDALLLPRLDGSFASLNELGQKKERKKKVITVNNPTTANDAATEEGEEEVETRISPRSRCRSEEVLSMREIVTNRRSGRYRTPTEEQPNFENHYYANISRGSRKSGSRHRIPTSPPPTRIPTPPPDLPPPPPVPAKPPGLFESNTELHYHSTEILNMLPKQRQPVPLSPVLSQSSANSAEYDDLQDFNDSKASPYSRRKSRNFKANKTKSADSLPEPDEIILVDDHYPKPTPPQSRSPKSSSEEDGFAVVVQVHRAPQESNL